MADFYTVKVESNRALTPEMRLITLSGGPADLYARYTVPGQYLQVAIGEGKPGFFAIASAPGERRFELLIKRSPGLAEELHAIRPGGEVRGDLQEARIVGEEESGGGAAIGADAFLAGDRRGEVGHGQRREHVESIQGGHAGCDE